MRIFLKIWLITFPFLVLGALGFCCHTLQTPIEQKVHFTLKNDLAVAVTIGNGTSTTTTLESSAVYRFERKI